MAEMQLTRFLDADPIRVAGKLPLETKVLFMATAKGEYVGQFSPTVEEILKQEIEGYGKILHLFSGASRIGEVRVDWDHPNATWHGDIVTFMEQDTEFWSYTILDPPYQIRRAGQKLQAYGRVDSVGGTGAMRIALQKWAPKHTWRLLWLDQCAPLITSFRRVKLWVLLPGGYATLRALSMLENNTVTQKGTRMTLEKFMEQ